MVQRPRSRNPNYTCQIINQTAGINIVADLPQQLSVTGQSSFTTWARMASPELVNSEYVTGAAGGSIMLKEFTKKIWQTSEGLGMSLSLIFDAEKSGREDVHDVARALMTLERPYQVFDGPFAILLPPNPTRLFGNVNVTSVRLGRMFFFESVCIHSVTYNPEIRLDHEGFPIAGQVDISFETDYAVSREDLQRIMAGTAAPSFRGR